MKLHPGPEERFQLMLLSGPARGARFAFAGFIFIGREPCASLQIQENSVSRLHAMIAHNGWRHMLYDVGSLSGTHLNGIRITRPCPLLNGDIISLGKHMHLVFLCALRPDSRSHFFAPPNEITNACRDGNPHAIPALTTRARFPGLVEHIL